MGGMHGRGHAHGGGYVWHGACMAGEMTTEADGTHSAGMHSCLIMFPNIVSHRPPL